ncbi:MAG: hypothetical protein ABI767_05000 [Rhodanobacter sp.]
MSPQSFGQGLSICCFVRGNSRRGDDGGGERPAGAACHNDLNPFCDWANGEYRQCKVCHASLIRPEQSAPWVNP